MNIGTVMGTLFSENTINAYYTPKGTIVSRNNTPITADIHGTTNDQVLRITIETVDKDPSYIYVDTDRVKIILTGNCSTLQLDSGDVTINGNVQGNIKVTSGNVEVSENAENIRTVGGDIKVGGDVSGDCRNVSGIIRVEGNVTGNCKSLSGNVTKGRK